jgi:sulfur carrier protein
MEVIINGEPRTIPEETSVAALLALLGIEGESVAVEVDRAIVRRAAWAERQLAPGARLEIVHFVGGG